MSRQRQRFATRRECFVFRVQRAEGEMTMGIFRALSRLFKGDSHAGTVEERVSGGDGRERRVLHPVPAVCERTLSDIRGIRVLAAACADERSRDAGTVPSDPLRRESRALIVARGPLFVWE